MERGIFFEFVKKSRKGAITIELQFVIESPSFNIGKAYLKTTKPSNPLILAIERDYKWKLSSAKVNFSAMITNKLVLA